MNNKPLMLVVVGMLVFTSTTMADKKFAHSKSLDMTFTAIGEPWCKPDVQMDVAAQDAAKFETSGYDDIIRKLGHVLVKECPEATTLSIKGEVNGEAAWQGSASRAEGWQASRKVAEATDSAAVAEKTQTQSAGEPPSQPKTVTAARATAEETQPAMQSTDSTASTTEESTPATKVPQAAVSATGAASGKADEAASLAKAETPKPESAPEPEPKPDETTAAPGEEPADSQPAVADSGFPDCDTLFKWATEMYELDKNTRGGSYVGGRYAGKTLLNSLKDDNLVPVFGEPITEWSDDDLDNWQTEFLACHADLQKEVKQLRGSNRYQTPLYKKFAGGQKYIDLLGMRRKTDDVFAYPQLIRHQIKVYGEHHKAVELRASQMKEIEGLEATNENVQKVSLMAADPQLQYLTANEQQAHRMALNMQLKLLRERVRQAQLRAQRQADIDQQFKVLTDAPTYDRVRFYTTLMFEPARLESSKINFEQQRNYYGGRGQTNPLNGAIQLTHPAQHFKMVKNGVGEINSPMYMLVKADDNEIESPYRMVVDANGSDEDIDGWMLVKADPEFHVKYDDGRPLFEISVDEAVACKSDMCVDEMQAGDLMRTWYDDDDMKFTVDTAASSAGGKSQ